MDARNWPVEVVNNGQSGDTTTGGLRRLDWLLRRSFAVLILELGANDGLRGISPALAEKNLRSIVDKTRAAQPDAHIVLCGMKVPPNMGRAYADEFEAIFPRLAEELDLSLVPFLLEGVGGNPKYNLPDGMHPNPEGQKFLADNVWKVLEPVLETILGES